MIIQRLLQGYPGGQFGDNLGSSLRVLCDHFRGILKISLRLLWGQIGGYMDVTLGYSRVISGVIFGIPLGSL